MGCNPGLSYESDKEKEGKNKNGGEREREQEIKQKHVHHPGQLVQSESAGVAISFV